MDFFSETYVLVSKNRIPTEPMIRLFKAYFLALYRFLIAVVVV